MANADLVIRELAPIGGYRVRVVRSSSGPKLDIREYVQADTFEGFTKRGVRLTMDQAEELRAALEAILDYKADPKAPVVEKSVATMSPEELEAAFALPAAPVAQPKILPVPMKPSSVLPPSLEELRARMRRGETVPLTGPGSLAEALANAKKAR